ncbi:MAG TPA: hypothetical protein VGE07_01875 [Herpetosiphonaceae bacterium]
MADESAPLVLAADARIDLQLHTVHSDGRWTPEALVAHLAAEQFQLAAITDHDQLATVAEVQALGSAAGVPLLAAVEMSSSWNGELTDVLCYGFDPAATPLAGLAEALRSGQQANLLATAAELERQGYAFPRRTEVLADSGGVPRQPQDLAELLRAHGHARPGERVGPLLEQAGFVWMTTDLAAIVAAAHASGAVCLLAHPGRADGFTTFDPDLLDELRRTIPIDGLEVEYPLHTPAQRAQFRAYAERHGLLMGAGSDSHGPDGQLPIPYPAAACRSLLERLGIRVLD